MYQQTQKSTTQEIELDIANLLKGIAFWEITVENQKLKLAENPNFDVNHVWRKIDQQNLGYIDRSQLYQFLGVNRIAASQRETDMLLHINSNQKGVMDKNAFYLQTLPQTNPDLRDYVLNRKEIQQKQENQHFTSDVMIGSFSEQQVAAIFGEELKFYREIEQLRSQFARSHGMTTNQVFQLVDYQNTNQIDLQCLQNFFTKVGIEFTEDEFWALQSRITNDFDTKIDYEELINAIMPKEPFDYPQFRQEFNGQKNKQYVINKCYEFNTGVNQPSFGKIMQKQQIDPEDYYHPLKKVFNPYEKGRNAYFCDRGYMSQLKEYRDVFYKPNKDYNFTYKNEGYKGLRYHDSYFKDFNNYLHERDQNESFFNKFGKRYQQEDKIMAQYEVQRQQMDKQKIDKFQSTVQLKPKNRLGSPRTIQNDITVDNHFQDF